MARRMTTAERRLWLKINRKAVAMTPELHRALLEAFKALANQLTPAQMSEALANPATFADRVYNDAVLRRSMAGFRTAVNGAVRESTLWYVAELPGGGIVQGAAAVGFNVLDPRVIEGIRTLDSRVIQTLGVSIREAVRLVIMDGLEKGLPHATMARRIRSIVGLAPNQVRAVIAFRDALESGDFSKALRYQLRDKRFDRTLQRLKASKGGLAQETIDRMTSAYERKFLAFNAGTNARTASMDAVRLGKHLATQEAIDVGILDGTKMVSEWIDAGDGRVRPLHQQADGEVVRFGQPFPTTGEIIPGSSTFNCRCIKVDRQVENVDAALVTNPIPLID